MYMTTKIEATYLTIRINSLAFTTFEVLQQQLWQLKPLDREKIHSMICLLLRPRQMKKPKTLILRLILTRHTLTSMIVYKVINHFQQVLCGDLYIILTERKY